MGIFLERARGLFHQKRYDLAERELLRELSNEPDNANAHALLGLCFNRLKRHEEALQSCREAVRLAPGSAYPHYALAYILDDRNQLGEAGDSIAEAIRLDPTDPYYHGLLSYIRLRQSRYEEALAAADEGLRLDARSVYCLNRRAMTLANMGRLEEAEQVIRTALSLRPEDAITLSNFGWILLQRKQGVAALEHLHEALRLDPHMDWARQKTIDALVFLIQTGKTSQADQYFTEALRRDPDLEEGRQRIVKALLGHPGGEVEGLIRALWFMPWLMALFGMPSTPLHYVVHGLLFCDILLVPGYRLLTDPVFSLFLGRRRLGRRLSSPQQRRAAFLLGAVLAVGMVVVALVGRAHPESHEPALLAAVAVLSLVLPVAASQQWPAWALRWLLPYGVLLFAASLVLILVSLLLPLQSSRVAWGGDGLMVLGVVVPSAVDRFLRRKG